MAGQKTRAQKIAEGLIPPSKQTAAEKAREALRLTKQGAKRILGVKPKPVKPRRTAKPRKSANSRKYR